MLISVFDLWILIDRCNLCVLSSLQEPAGTMYNSVKIIQIQEVSVPSLLKENHTTTCMSWSRCCFKKNHVNYVLKINTNIKFTIKYTPFSTQHVLITRCIEETNGDDYKKIITRNCCPSWTSRLSIMNIAASTMTLQTNCCDQTFVSIRTFRELQSVSMMDAWKWCNPSCLDCIYIHVQI
jgi:hypothetical protein